MTTDSHIHHVVSHNYFLVYRASAVQKYNTTPESAYIPPGVVYMLTQEWCMPYMLTCSSM